MNNKFKTQLQQKEFLSLKNRDRVILRWATGCGKSKMAIDLINNIVDSKSTTSKVLFVVAERAHINNWQDEFDKWNLHYNKVATDVVCYASLHKMQNTPYDIIVYDEAHHLFTEKRLSIIENMPASYVFLLSATLPQAKIDTIKDIYGNFTISTVTLKDAIKKDILSDPRVYVIEMLLDNRIPDQEIKIGNQSNAPTVNWEERMKFLSKNLPCKIRCTEQQKYIHLTNVMEYWKQRYERSKNPYHRNLWVNTGSIRKRFLGERKTEAVYRMISRMPKGRRFVCFCASIAQADALSSTNTISSKKTAGKNQFIIWQFNARRINSIYAVGMITEGMNLTDIEAGIIVQLDGKERLFIQKFGRSMRAQDPVSYIFYFKGTQDELYLKKALENIDAKFIRYININQLNAISL